MKTQNPYITHANLNAVTFDEYGLAAIQRLAQKAGDKDVEFGLVDGQVRVVRRFYYEGGDDERCEATRHYTLDEYLLLILRYKRIQGKKLSQIQSAFDKFSKDVQAIRKELQGHE